MQTAVTIPDGVFDDAERLAARFKTSRSELYTRAIAEFIARHDGDSVTRALDDVAQSLSLDHPDPWEVASRARAILHQVEW